MKDTLNPTTRCDGIHNGRSPIDTYVTRQVSGCSYPRSSSVRHFKAGKAIAKAGLLMMIILWFLNLVLSVAGLLGSIAVQLTGIGLLALIWTSWFPRDERERAGESKSAGR